MATDASPRSNTLGKASLVLGIIGSFFVFLVGLCAGVGHQQGWLKAVGAVLFVIGGAFAFLGVVSILLGVLGLFSSPRGTAIAGLILGLANVWLFVAIVQAAQG